MRIPEAYERVKEQAKDSVAFMGLSLGKPLFYDRGIMGSYIGFLHENFMKSYLLIADKPKRYNIMALEGISENDVLVRISKASKDMRIFLRKLSSKYEDIYIVDWSEVADDNYQHNLAILTLMYQQNEKFREECGERVIEFLSIPSNSKKIEQIGSTLEKALEIASRYHLEELAMLLSLPISLGEKVCEIYPGVDSVQEKLQSGRYDFCSKLRKNPNRLFMEVYYG